MTTLSFSINNAIVVEIVVETEELQLPFKR
jgi:hypothetical protein